MDLLLTSLAYPLSLTKNTKINLITSEDMNIKVNNEALDFKGKTVAELRNWVCLPLALPWPLAPTLFQETHGRPRSWPRATM